MRTQSTTKVKLLALVALVLLLLLITGSSSVLAQTYNPVTTINVTENVLLQDSKRMGMNVGYYDQFGAAQFLKNIVPNPGFEGAEMASIILADHGASATHVRAANWSVRYLEGIGGPEFWVGGSYEILTGPAKGRSGIIKQVTTPQNGYVFHFSNSGTPPPAGSVIAIRSPKLSGYHMNNRSSNVIPDTNHVRPGSPGKQSLRIKPISYNGDPLFFVAFDSLARDGDPSAGKMRIVEGNWFTSFWVKAEHAGMSVEFNFGRHRGQSFHREIIPLRPGWQQISRRFYVPPGADLAHTTNALTVRVAVARGQSDIWLDDMVLRKADETNPTVFSDNFVDLLNDLRPGVLRDWGHQFGSSLDNQLASPHARLSNGYHPHRTPKEWHYSIHEFLALCKEVGAEPWYVIPPTWSAQELQNFVGYLSAPAGRHPYANHRAGLGQSQPWTSVFPRIHLEYGNELWSYNGDNQPGQGFSMGGAVLGGAIGTADAADNRFGVLRGAPWFNPGKFNLIVSGQVNHPDLQGQIERRLGSHDSIGIAPYFGDIQQYNSLEQMYQPLYASALQDVSAHGRVQESRASMNRNGGQNTDIAVYEINTQLRSRSAPLAQRNEWYTSLGTGLALPLHMLTLQRDLGVNIQTAFTAAQYSKPTSHQQWDQLWGLVRDVEATQRKRPGWLGLEMANSAIRGQMLETRNSGDNPHWTQPPINTITQPINVPYIQSFAYRGRGHQYSLVIFNLHLYSPKKVQLNLPGDPYGNATIRIMSAPNISDDNESAENVRIYTYTRFLKKWERLELPPHSMVVVQWNE